MGLLSSRDYVWTKYWCPIFCDLCFYRKIQKPMGQNIEELRGLESIHLCVKIEVENKRKLRRK